MGVEPKFNIKNSKAKEGFAVFFGKLYKSCKTCNELDKKDLQIKMTAQTNTAQF